MPRNMRKICLKIVAPNMGKIVARNMYFLSLLLYKDGLDMAMGTRNPNPNGFLPH